MTPFWGLHCKFGMSKYLHTVSYRSRTGRKRLGSLFDLNQTHPAISGNRKFFVVAEMRDIHPNLLRSIHHGAAIRHLRLFAVDFDFLACRYLVANLLSIACEKLVQAGILWKPLPLHCSSFGTKQVLCSMWYSNSLRKCFRKL